MLVAILGDTAGSTYERTPASHKNIPLFPALSRFTDDSVRMLTPELIET